MRKIISFLLVIMLCQFVSNGLASTYDTPEELHVGERITYERQYVIGFENFGFSESEKTGKQKFSVTFFIQNLSQETMDMQALELITAKLVYIEYYPFTLGFEKYCYVSDTEETCSQLLLEPLMEIYGIWSVDVPDAVARATEGQLALVITFPDMEYRFENITSKVSNHQHNFEGPGYDTPEDAAVAYLLGLKKRDYPSMLSTFAIESFIDNYILSAFLERVQTYSLVFDIRLPSNDDCSREMNVLGRLTSVIDMISLQALFFSAPTAYNDGLPTMLQTEELRTEFLATMSKEIMAYPFADLEILDVQQAEQIDERYSSELNQKNLARQVTPYVRDINDMTNLGVTFLANGHKWIFCPELLRYKDKWYIFYLGGNLSSILGINSHSGGIKQIE